MQHSASSGESAAATAVFLVDHARGSYARAAELYAAAFREAGLSVEMRPYPDEPPADLTGRWVVHHTVGPLFRRVPGALNTAIVFHEWSRYPSGWLAELARFDSVWAPSRHCEMTLAASGLASPLAYVPPPLAFAAEPSRASWAPGESFRLLAVGEPHFRKGFHLLLDGFQRAFPTIGEATLTLKVSAACTWTSPRADISLIRAQLAPAELAALYDSHDALVSASLGEGLGLPLAEAADSLLPLAVNLWGGHGEIAAPDTVWVIDHEEVPQLFCSAPSYYADGQRCAYSSPVRIAAALRAMVAASPAEREARARRAHAALHARHSVAVAAARVREHALVPALR